MEYKVNYLVVGVFVLVLFFLMIFGIFWLSSSDHRRPYTEYLVYMNESVNGLSEQAPVKFNGVNIGYVKSITLNPNNLQQVKLLLKIEEGIPITKSTYASLKAQGVTGITYIGLESKRVKSAPLVARPGEDYPVIDSQPSLLVQLGDTIRDVSTNISSLSVDVQQAFDEKNRASLEQTLANLSVFTRHLAENSEKFDKTLAQAEIVATNSAQVSQALIEILPQIKVISSNLEKLSMEVQQNPSILLRGKALTANGPGE